MEDSLEINIVGFNLDDKGHKCGYCNNPNGSCSFGLTIQKYPAEIYEKMMKDGWRRCGDYVYLPNLEKSCCKLYTCRLDVENFKINKNQKKIMKRFRKYLSGEYDPSKEKEKEEEKPEKEKEVKIDETKEKIEKMVKEYIKTKKYIEIINKYIKIDNSLIEGNLNESYVRINANKKFNFDYSIDFIYIINKRVESYIKKNGIKFDDIKKLNLELFNDFKQFYNPNHEEIELELYQQTGHINIIDKTKPKKVTVEKKIENNKNENEIKEKKPKKEKKKEKEKKNETIPEKYSLEYFPEIVNEPEIHLPLKHIYTCELTDKIQINDDNDERLKVYQKYQNIIHKENPSENTKEKFNRAWGQTNLVDNKGIKLPNDLDKKVKHPEIFPKKYGTYNFIHRIDGKIVAVGIWDILPTSLSSVYLYYDTDYQFLDLGVFTAIREIEYMKSFHDLIDKNFKYYMMGFYCETVQKLRYKGFYHPTELLDRFSMNYVLLDKVQNLIKDGKNHKLCDKQNNDYKFMNKNEISNYIKEMFINYKKNNNDNYMYLTEFAIFYINPKYSDLIISMVERFLEIIPTNLLDKIKFIAKFR